MSWKSPAFTLPSFKSSLLERSLAPSTMVRGLGALAGAAAGKQADDLLVVVRRVDVVGPAGRGHDVEQLGPALEHLARAGVPGQREEIAPQLARQDDGRRPAFRARGRDRRSRAFSTPGPQEGGHGPRSDQRLVAEDDHRSLDLLTHRAQSNLDRRSHPAL